MANAGMLRDRVTFERLNDGTDDLGNVSDGTWSEIGGAGQSTVWGGFRPERSGERLEAGRTESSVMGTLTVRSSTVTRSITEADRVQIDSVAYDIRGITNPDRRNKYLEMTVERGVAV